MKKDDLFCLNCGQEVQWVPDYDSFGDYMVQGKNCKKEKEQAEAAAARKRAAIAAENRRRKKAKKKRMILVSVAGVLVLVAAGLFFQAWYGRKKITTILITRSAWQILHFPITNTKKAINL